MSAVVRPGRPPVEGRSFEFTNEIIQSPHLKGDCEESCAPKRARSLSRSSDSMTNLTTAVFLMFNLSGMKRGDRQAQIFCTILFQDPPLLNRLFDKLGFPKTDNAFINLTDPAALCPENLRPDIIHQKARARIGPKRLDLSPGLGAVKNKCCLQKISSSGRRYRAFLGHHSQAPHRHTFQQKFHLPLAVHASLLAPQFRSHTCPPGRFKKCSPEPSCRLTVVARFIKI